MADAPPAPDRPMLGADAYALICSPCPDGDSSRFAEVLPQHLDWIGQLEQAGTLLLAGPLVSGPGVGQGSGLIVVRAGSDDEAEALAAQDPLVVEGLRTTAVHHWKVNEGSLDVRLVLSRGVFEWR